LLLHPQQRKALIEILAGKKNRRERNFLKKDSEKLAEFEKSFYICTPQNGESSLTDWEKKTKKWDEKKVSIFFRFFLQETKRIFSFA
ncbi:hypothetical protein, partial [Flavobacterium ginsenosidimutans]|uniref:hypothetical protein n=1 Tax=Flavobacterium ginsenosidimutans TaxID=687844 RepID=UPI0019520D65